MTELNTSANGFQPEEREHKLSIFNRSFEHVETGSIKYGMAYVKSKKISDYFENKLRLHRVTSIEITKVQKPNLDCPDLKEKSRLSDKIERKEIVKMRTKFLTIK